MNKPGYMLCAMLMLLPAFVCQGQESIELSADRDMYIAGETLEYHAGYFLDGQMIPEPFSKVLYVELITNSGKKIAQAKKCFSDSIVSGKLRIPCDTRSGNYYLRAYTKYMRNFSPLTYSYRLVCVVNPYSVEVVQDVGPQETVVKDTTVYHAEINGLTISGRVEGAFDHAPREGAEISISTVADAAYFAITTTDSAGNFVFELPWDLKNTEFTISAGGYEQGSVNILVDSEFCNKEIRLEYIPFIIQNEAEVLTLVHRYQEERQHSISSPDETGDTGALPFYGKPGRVVHEKDYIQLKSIGEFVFELLYEFKYDEASNFLYPTGNFSLKFSPVLVLIDNIRVHDIRSFLELPARRVKRFEITRGGYIIGEMSFGGILNVVSEQGDMAGYIDQTERIYFEFGTACQ
jgi:hypothetical protein